MAERPSGSEYMQWARTRPHARFDLATSGMPNAPLSDIGVSADDLELTGGTEYGYAPLLEAIAARSGPAPQNVVTAAGARVLVDEVYLDAALEHAPRSAFHLGPDFVVTSSLTKVYGLSGLRCGWILADAETARGIWRLNDLFGVAAPHPAERMSARA